MNLQMKKWTVAAGLATVLTVPAMGQDATVPAPTSSAAQDQVITRSTFRNVAKKVSPAVVNIKIKSNIVFGRGGRGGVSIPQNFPLDDGMRELLEQLLERESPHWTPSEREDYRYSQSASGVVIRPDGYIVTSNHVVEKARPQDIEVSLPNGKSYENVEVVGTDELTDLAILKVNDTNMTAVEWGDSDSVEPGDHVVAIGNPLEFNNSVSEGIVSAKHRTINKAAIEDLIQTTAMINPGNSGGALVDLDGKLVGINMAIATSTGLWSGLGFAIPSKTVKDVAEQIIDRGKVGRGYLGIEMKSLTGALAQQLGYQEEAGIVVENVRPDSAAEKAGLQRYDIISRVNGKPIKEPTDMHRQIGVRRAGETVELEVFRDEGRGELKKQIVKVQLDERPTRAEIEKALKKPVEPAAPGQNPATAKPDNLGLNVVPNPDGKGVIVDSVEPGSRAALAGIKKGDIIYDLNRKAISSQEELENAVKERNKDNHLLYYESNGVTGLQTIPVE